MNQINAALDKVRSSVRALMRALARFLHRLSGGRISPDMITLTSLLGHIPVALLISQGYFGYAAIGLVFFGLMDALDGELARLQKKASSRGMLLDASTDRFKEVMLYTAIGYVLVFMHGELAAWAVLALGASISVSYVKAKGETAVTGQRLSPNQINRLFQDGLLRYEIRMAILIIGLLSGYLLPAVIIIAIGSSLTAIDRLIKISRALT
jgi:CDP-diacylglycerol---glycerol-3-phosphate 3-phosphatidyltransferase